MKVELHLHTSRYSPCARANPFELMEALIGYGYEAVFITEHDHVWSDWELGQLQEEFRGLKIFPGVELTLGPDQAQHLLVLGTLDPGYLELREDPRRILEKARRDGDATILAHPFRWQGGGEMLDDGLIPDALENLTCNHEPAHARLAQAAGELFSLPVVNAGDVHALEFLDRFWIETEAPLVEARDIREILVNRRFRNCVR